MIEIDSLNKKFVLKDSEVHAVNDVSLNIQDGEVYGVIGYSGAGKSTLVRCINFLERPDSGSISISGFGKITAENRKLYLNKDGRKREVKEQELRALRRSIGMIFQHFNLFDRRTVYDNIVYSLKHTGTSKEKIQKRVDELLHLVDLEGKRNMYPSQLSGGQKQRVAIARALANSPKILLSDEATSALDPDATESILQLLKKLNQEYGLTIVIITHEMAVIREIADRVAVMENGSVVEKGNVYDIFADPQQSITKKFVESSSPLGNIKKLLTNKDIKEILSDNRKLIRLTFTKNSVGHALISEVSREYGVDINIILGNVDIISSNALGGIIAEISGDAEKIDKAIAYLQSCDVKTEVIENA